MGHERDSLIVYGVVGPCKPNQSQKPVPLHPLLAERLGAVAGTLRNRKSEDWSSRAGGIGVGNVLGTCDLTQIHRPAAKNQGIEKRIGWHYFGVGPTRPFSGASARNSGDSRADAAFLYEIHVGHLCQAITPPTTLPSGVVSLMFPPGLSRAPFSDSSARTLTKVGR